MRSDSNDSIKTSEVLHESVTKTKATNLRPMMQRYASESEEANPHSELNWSSYKERRVDALALRADERRDKLR